MCLISAANLPIHCLRCDKVVDAVTVWEDDYGNTVKIRTRCHGETAMLVVDGRRLREAQRELYQADRSRPIMLTLLAAFQEVLG